MFFFHLFEVIEGERGAPGTPVEKWRKKCVISLTSLLLCVSGAPRPLRAGFRSPEKRKIKNYLIFMTGYVQIH